MSGKKVSILLHELARYDDSRHPFIWYFAEIWKKSGIKIEVLRGVPSNPVSTDVLIVHVDLTILPPEYSEFICGFPNAINGRLADISKRKISSDILSQNDSYYGEVIVKTDLNYGGIPELEFESRAGQGSKFMSHVQRPWRKIDYLDPEKYPIFGSVKDVPSGVWRNRNLIVEKFIPERDGDLYGTRAAFFMGEKSFCLKVYSKSPIVKGSGIIRSEHIDTPIELEKARKKLGLDYGKIDYVVLAGEIHILDVNKTLGGGIDEETNWKYAAALSDGLLPYLG